MKFEHILVGVDFSETSREAVRAAARLAGDARVTLLHVWHAAHPYTAFSGSSTDEVHAAVAANEAEIDEYRREAHELGATNVTSVFLAGNPADEIIELAHKDPTIDLIVVGTHGRSGLAHVLIGSVAEKILRRSPCAVLAIPANVARGRRRPQRQAAAASIH